MTERTAKQQRPHLFQPGKSGNPAGRPRGARNKTTLAAQALLEGEAQELTRLAVEKAKEGDMQALRLCLERILPPLKSQHATVLLELPETRTLADIAHALLQAAANGRLAPDLAAQMVGAVGTLAKVTEMDELQERLAALELAVGRK